MLTSGSHMFVLDSAVIISLGITKPKPFFPKQQPYSIWRFRIFYGFLNLRCLIKCVFSSRKQELLKYFSIFFFYLSSSIFYLLPTLIKYCQYVIYTYIQVLLIIFLIISDYFFFDFFRFFPIFSDFFRFFQKNFLDILFIFLHFFQHFFTIQSFFNTIFTRALDLHLKSFWTRK